jgi:hypothetical protein
MELEQTEIGRREMQHFWTKVVIRDPAECWDWTDYVYGGGVGLFWSPTYGKQISAPRYSFMLAHGSIPPHSGHAFCVLHSCDRRICVNPYHLSLGSQRENMLDMTSKGRRVGNRRLTDAQVTAIRYERHQHERTLADIGREFGISKEHVSRLTKAA